jgi:hypothetical protein
MKIWRISSKADESNLETGVRRKRMKEVAKIAGRKKDEIEEKAKLSKENIAAKERAAKEKYTALYEGEHAKQRGGGGAWRGERSEAAARHNQALSFGAFGASAHRVFTLAPAAWRHHGVATIKAGAGAAARRTGIVNGGDAHICSGVSGHRHRGVPAAWRARHGQASANFRRNVRQANEN